MLFMWIANSMAVVGRIRHTRGLARTGGETAGVEFVDVVQGHTVAIFAVVISLSQKEV